MIYMKISIFIENGQLCKHSLEKRDNTFELTLYFDTPKEFKEFLKNPVPKVEDFDEYSNTSDILDFLSFIINHSHKYIKAITSANPHIELNETSPINSELFTIGIPSTINIKGLSFNKKLEILTHPKLNDSIAFLDDYTLNDEIPASVLQEMYETIWAMCESVKSKGFSPAEYFFYIYNKLKEREYIQENENDSPLKSRSLVEVLKNDEIVCVGFSNYFLAIADVIGLIAKPIRWENIDEQEPGHESVIVFLNDPKYRIMGIFDFDTTWDAKKEKNKETYKNNIRHAFIPPVIDAREKELNGLITPSGNSYHNIFSAYESLQKLEILKAPEIIIKHSKIIVVKRINDFYSLLGCHYQIDDNCDLESEIAKVQKYGYNRIPITTLENIILAVTPKSEEDLSTTIQTNPNYIIAPAEERLLYSIFHL